MVWALQGVGGDQCSFHKGFICGAQARGKVAILIVKQVERIALAHTQLFTTPEGVWDTAVEGV
jgi:hypothetical protein